MCMGRDRKGDKADKGEAVIWILLPLTDIAGTRAWMQREEGVLAMVKSELLAVGDVDPQVVHCLER